MYIVVICTVPGENKAYEISKKIIENKLAACVNYFKAFSIFEWKGKIEEVEEYVLIIKTKEETFPKLEDFIKKLHPYQVPEIISLKIDKGNLDYLKWIEETVKGSNP
ncbi:MAG: divalent-cation tolerance protein CutA [Candidatus Hydrothermales bacterium]